MAKIIRNRLVAGHNPQIRGTTPFPFASPIDLEIFQDENGLQVFMQGATAI